jgi:WD40 repeat protein
MNEHQIVVGSLDGKVLAYNYTYELEDICKGFGKKVLTSVRVKRSITNMDISTDLVVASSSYSGAILFKISDTEGNASISTFNDSIFISSVSIMASLKTFAVGTFNNRVLVYIDSDSGYELNQTILTDSQVTTLDLSKDSKLLVGMMNGDLA